MEKNLKLFGLGALGALLAVAWLYGVLGFLFGVLMFVLFSLLGFYYGAASVLCSGRKYTIPVNERPSAVTDILLKMVEQRKGFRVCNRKIVTSRNLDLAIQELMDLIAQDYIVPWYKDLAWDHERFVHLAQDDMWIVMEKFSERLQRIDWVAFLARNVMNALTRHFHEIRVANRTPGPDVPKPKFILHPWLASPEKEEEFLRKVAEVFLLYLLPESYAKCDTPRHLFREILACTVFQPGVSIICDPDYINQKIYSWLEYREQLAKEHRRTYTYAATYEDFMKMIEECNDVEHLKQIRYNIISEIMQATTIQNLKRAKGMDIDKESSPKGTSKGDLLKARNLKRYLNQLSVTKSYCEKRLHSLGGTDYRSSSTEDSASHDLHHIPGRKILSFQVIMESSGARQHMMKYLHRSDQESLLSFWTSVESMKQANKRLWHQMAAEVYQMYVTPSGSQVRGHLDRLTIRNMEAFMIGDMGPDAFWDGQKQVAHVLEEKHYPSFILSDIYHHYIVSLETGDTASASALPSELKASATLRSPGFSEDTTIRTRRITEHSTYAQQKLSQLEEKISNKTQALKAIRKSQKSDAKMQRLQEDIELEIAELTQERDQLVSHIESTDLWAVNLGRWKVRIYSTEEEEEEEKKTLCFVLQVHLPDIVGLTASPDNTRGWIISRKLDDFTALHKELTLILPELKKRRIPRIGKSKMKSKDYLDKAKDSLQDYLDVVLSNEHLSQSEAVFAFFSPSPEHLKSAADLQKAKDTKLSFPSLFKNLSSKQQDSDSEDELLFGEGDSTKTSHRKDWIADPLYMLIGEVFELAGVFKWLRRSLMVFVQVTFGRSINRQVRETVNWILSEPMLVFYLHSFRDAYWPDGTLADRAPSRSDEEKLQTRLKAKEKFLQNIPDALKNLVGEKNARQGAIKMFESLQDVRLNKHLFYVLLQAFLYELFPELHHFEKLEAEERRKADEHKRSQNRARESSEEEREEDQELEDAEETAARQARRPNIPVSRLHNSTAFWMRI